jgi:superfamily II DNA or RNA helicase
MMLTSKGIAGNEIGYYVGGMTKMELGLSKVKPLILGTYKMCSTGTDVPAWDSLVMATPRADIKQPVGRVLRALDGKKKPVILDLVDYDSIFQNFHLSRIRQYYELGSEIVKVA